jgi:hypothetical protein
MTRPIHQIDPDLRQTERAIDYRIQAVTPRQWTVGIGSKQSEMPP